MTTEDNGMQQGPPVSRTTPDLRLRGERPRVTRLSRKVLIGMACVSALAITGLLGYALQTRDKLLQLRYDARPCSRPCSSCR